MCASPPTAPGSRSPERGSRMKKGVYIMRDARRLPPRLQRITRQQSRQHLGRTHGGGSLRPAGAPEGCRGLQRAAEGSRGLQRAPEVCRGLQRAAEGCRGLQRAPEGSRGLQRLLSPPALSDSCLGLPPSSERPQAISRLVCTGRPHRPCFRHRAARVGADQVPGLGSGVLGWRLGLG